MDTIREFILQQRKIVYIGNNTKTTLLLLLLLLLLGTNTYIIIYEYICMMYTLCVLQIHAAILYYYFHI